MATFGVNQPRFYRVWGNKTKLLSFKAKVRETDLYIKASSNLKKEAVQLIKKYRMPIEDYIKKHPDFKKALVPYKPCDDMPPIIRDMVAATKKVGVGPMAAVAGAIAEYVGYELLKKSDEVIIENGGDIFIKVKRPMNVGVYAAKSPFSRKILLAIDPKETPIGICTSSGTVGPSLSFGSSDAAIALAPSATFADACATALGNLVKKDSDITKALEYAKTIDGLRGVVLIKGKIMGAWGKVKFA